MTLIQGTHLLAQQRDLLNHAVLIDRGKIVKIISPQVLRRRKVKHVQRAHWVIPGLIDLHSHGGGNGTLDSEKGLRELLAFHAKQGTTALMLSIFYPGLDQLTVWAERIKEIRKSAPIHILGLHLEGPWINPQAAGSIPRKTIHSLPIHWLLKIVVACQGELKMVTLAPELHQAEGLINLCRRYGIIPAIGHSLANSEQTYRAADWGAKLVTHLGNAMRPWHHRDPGMVGAGLSDSRLAVELIADGKHLAPETLEMFFRAKQGPTLLISDCRSRGDLLEETKSGTPAIVKPVGGKKPLWASVRWLITKMKMDPQKIFLMATKNPADVMGQTDRGEIRVGAKADLMLINKEFKIQSVMVGGNEI
jgi:N-acetylglucosamine-6-phosphate deacetylase